MSQTPEIVIARGDGIGPEITDAVLKIFESAGVELRYHFIDVGEALYLKGVTSGITPESLELIRKHGVMLKGPITTPLGKGYKSVNVTIRKSLGLFANVRPFKAYAPYVPSYFPTMDLVIVRENEEDLYAGIEHQQTDDVVQVLKLLSLPGSERIVRYAFEHASAYGRKKVTCMTKDNIMKISDGMFHRIFDEIAAEYPDIKTDHQIIDIGSARIASKPESFDVIVTLNLYGDIISDIAAEVAGSVGMSGSANIGERSAMFEAIHGSAPDIAGKGLANPSGMLTAAIQMLVYLGLGEKAQLIQDAWLSTLESGHHTGDIYRDGESKKRVGTVEFTQSIIDRLGETPKTLKSVRYGDKRISIPTPRSRFRTKKLTGADIFLCWNPEIKDPLALGKQVTDAIGLKFSLKGITNRGTTVYPDGPSQIYCTDHWVCRFLLATENAGFADVIALQQLLTEAGLEVIKTENLYSFDGLPGYSLGQGE
jgi:isocitrate dehydrogenase